MLEFTRVFNISARPGVERERADSFFRSGGEFSFASEIFPFFVDRFRIGGLGDFIGEVWNTLASRRRLSG